MVGGSGFREFLARRRDPDGANRWVEQVRPGDLGPLPWVLEDDNSDGMGEALARYRAEEMAARGGRSNLTCGPGTSERERRARACAGWSERERNWAGQIRPNGAREIQNNF